MNSLAFEQMLSHNPKLSGFIITEVCLRDMIFQYYLKFFDEQKADKLTTEYIAKLWEHVGTRTA